MELFERDDWRLFTSYTTLPQKAGVSKDDLDRVVLKELMDNALDAGTGVNMIEDFDGFVSISNRGKGMTKDVIERVYSVNRPLVSSKLIRLPSRGALGNGLRVVSGAVIATNGDLRITSKGIVYDISWTEGIASATEVDRVDDLELTDVRIRLGHWEHEFDEEWTEWARYTLMLSDDYTGGSTYKGKTSAYWYNSEQFMTLCGAYSGKVESLALMFSGITKDKLRDADYVGNRYEDYRDRYTKDLTSAETVILHGILLGVNSKEIKSIGHVGKGGFDYNYERGHDGFGKFEYGRVEGSYRSAHNNDNRFHDWLPVTYEVWVSASKDKRESSDIRVYVNKTLITGDVSVVDKKDGTWINVGGSKYWRDIKVKGPLSIRVNIQTPYMPIKSDGKAPDFSEFMYELTELLLKTAKKAVRKLDGDKATRKTLKEVMLGSMEDAIAKASGNGEYLFSQRQLFYAVRPYVISIAGKEPDYNYFCKVLTDYENVVGDVEGLYRDPRGVLYHPHTGEEIPIGTLAVNDYARPEWTFNKILYSEKEGFFTILKKVKFPERFDCALLTSKGYASRAVKDLFDLLGETDEEIQFFCIHDADSAGTKIFETLSAATRSHRGTKVTVTNLGLDPWEALEMGLEVENVADSDRRRPVAGYVERNPISPKSYGYDNYDWESWLQEYRVELNAMTTPQFLEWLESKMEAYGVGKVVPTEEVLQSTYVETQEALVRSKLLESVLSEVGFEEMVANAVNELGSAGDLSELVDNVRKGLTDNMEAHWSRVVRDIASDRL